MVLHKCPLMIIDTFMDRHPSNVAWVRWAARSSWKAMGCSLQPIPTDIEGTCWIRLMRRCVRRMASIRSLSKILIAYSWSKTLAVLTQAPFAQAHCQNQSEHLALPRVPKRFGGWTDISDHHGENWCWRNYFYTRWHRFDMVWPIEPIKCSRNFWNQFMAKCSDFLTSWYPHFLCTSSS